MGRLPANASFVIENLNVVSHTSAGIFVNPILQGDNLGPFRQLLRGGSVTLNNLILSLRIAGLSPCSLAAG